jgi:hypothetical protein
MDFDAGQNYKCANEIDSEESSFIILPTEKELAS